MDITIVNVIVGTLDGTVLEYKVNRHKNRRVVGNTFRAKYADLLKARFCDSTPVILA